MTARKKVRLVRLRPYAGISLLSGRPYAGLRLSLNLGEARRHAKAATNDDHAGYHGPARKSLWNDN
jgi:hypothetical protein